MVVPVLLHGRGAPLPFRFERARSDRGAAEIEAHRAVCYRLLHRPPIQELVRTLREELAQRGDPRNGYRVALTQHHRSADRPSVSAHDDEAGPVGELYQDLLEEPARVNRRTEVAQVAREDAVEVIQRLEAVDRCGQA